MKKNWYDCLIFRLVSFFVIKHFYIHSRFFNSWNVKIKIKKNEYNKSNLIEYIHYSFIRNITYTIRLIYNIRYESVETAIPKFARTKLSIRLSYCVISINVLYGMFANVQVSHILGRPWSWSNDVLPSNMLRD